MPRCDCGQVLFGAQQCLVSLKVRSYSSLPPPMVCMSHIGAVLLMCAKCWCTIAFDPPPGSSVGVGCAAMAEDECITTWQGFDPAAGGPAVPAADLGMVLFCLASIHCFSRVFDFAGFTRRLSRQECNRFGSPQTASGSSLSLEPLTLMRLVLSTLPSLRLVVQHKTVVQRMLSSSWRLEAMPCGLMPGRCGQS